MKLSKRQENLLKHTFVDYTQTSEFIKNPVIMNKAEGLYCWDLDGKEYFEEKNEHSDALVKKYKQI